MPRYTLFLTNYLILLLYLLLLHYKNVIIKLVLKLNYHHYHHHHHHHHHHHIYYSIYRAIERNANAIPTEKTLYEPQTVAGVRPHLLEFGTSALSINEQLFSRLVDFDEVGVQLP